jgi:hypothetical protein
VNCSLFLDTLPITSGKTVASVTLPSPGTSNLQIVAIALNAN